MKVLIAGDFCECHRVAECIRLGDTLSPLSDVRAVTQAHDYAILNLEFPIVMREGHPIAKNGPHLKGHKESVQLLKTSGFSCCTLANNHILDQGESCALETKSYLEGEGLDTVGLGKNTQEACNILFLNINGEKLAIINCCEHEFSCATDITPGANALNPVQQFYQIQEAKKKANYILVIVHGGHEHFQLPSLRMIETYRFFIDAGADAVVNHHQHCYSGFEIYKEKPIFYGLGNFLFDNPTQRNTSWNEGYLVSLDFHNGQVNHKLIPYNQCNEMPKVCLLTGEEQKNFEIQINRLNAIIANKEILKKNIESYFNACSSYEMEVLEPYSSRVTRKLHHWHLLPHRIKGDKKLSIRNHIDCESHRDKLLHALKKEK